MTVFNMTDTTVTAATKMRDYYKIDKYLGGLIKVTRLLYSERAGQEVNIHIPNKDDYDNIYINGIEYTPATQGRKDIPE